MVPLSLQMSDQWATVLDDWATRFFEEMDYQLEACNTIAFKKQMASLQGIQVRMQSQCGCYCHRGLWVGHRNGQRGQGRCFRPVVQHACAG